MKSVLKLILGKSSQIDQVLTVLERNQGGVYKRLDENRELLEHIQWHVPEYLNAHPWVGGWIETQDMFLLDLIAAAELEPPRVRPGFKWPRPWPSMARAQFTDLTDHGAVAPAEGQNSQAVPKNKTSQPLRKILDFEGNEQLRKLVETMDSTGLFQVFHVSKGHVHKVEQNPWSYTRAPSISFWASAKDARALGNALADVEPDLTNSKSRLASGRHWDIDARFTTYFHEYETVCRLYSRDLDRAAKSLTQSMRLFGPIRADVDGDFNSLRELICQRFPKLDEQEDGK